MSIVEARDENGQVLKGKNGNIIYRYQKPAWRVLYNSLADLLDVFERYLNVQQDVKIEDFNIDKVLLSEILFYYIS